MEFNSASIPPVVADNHRSVQQRPAAGANQAAPPPPAPRTVAERANNAYPAAQVSTTNRGGTENQVRILGQGNESAVYDRYQSLSRLSESDMDNLVYQANRHLQPRNLELNYRMHEGTNRYFLTIYDADTQEIAREIPPEWSLDMLANILDLTGMFMNERG